MLNMEIYGFSLVLSCVFDASCALRCTGEVCSVRAYLRFRVMYSGEDGTALAQDVSVAVSTLQLFIVSVLLTAGS